MKRLPDNTSFVILLLMLLVTSCNDLMEKNIADKSIEIIMPADSYVTSRNQVEFRWDGGRDLHSCRFQIVSPGFSNIEQFFVDTLISGNQIRVSLPPGNFQWRIRGENSGSQTPFYTRSFTIDTSADFTGLVFAVNTPAALVYTNQLQVMFSWTKPLFATKFEYQACDSNKAVLRTKFSYENSLIDSFSEGVYYWRMRAVNETNNTVTAYSPFSKLVIDTTRPAVHSQIIPVDESQLTNNVTLTWQSTPDARKYNVVVSTDSNFLIHVLDVESESSSYTTAGLTENTTYYWTLRAADNCGNWSSFAKPYKFTVIP